MSFAQPGHPVCGASRRATGAGFVRRLVAGHLPGVRASLLAGLTIVLVGPAPVRLLAGEDENDKYQTRLFIADSDGSNIRQLTNLNEYQCQGSPCWSLDGKFIAFDGWRPQRGEAFAASQVIVVNVDGKNPRVLGPGAMPSYSPGGNRIAYSLPGGGGVWVMSSDGPEQENIQIDARGWGTDWSRDGRLAYTATTGGGDNLAIYNFVEGSVDVVFDKGHSPYRQIFWNMAWSPDGKRIAFRGVTPEGKEEIGIVDARGEKFGHIRRVEGPVVPSLAWSPNAAQILFVRKSAEVGRFQIFSVVPDTQAPPELLPKQDANRDYSDICYSPDGKKIVFSCHPPVTKKKQ